MRDRYVLLGLLGIFLIAVGLAGTAYSDMAGVAPAQATKEERHNPLHEQMGQMMGEGASHRMHEAMPGSEEMMELCTGMMLGTNATATRGPMGGGMMGPGMMGRK
ncbi:MAG: hypothetical protein HY555_05820 [Euryarchaeota archaeon]|nr:hypothetical protein [Euryarchaeota archaeon]